MIMKSDESSGSEKLPPGNGRGKRRAEDLPPAAKEVFDRQAEAAAKRRAHLRETEKVGRTVFGERLRAARQRSNKTQSEVANHLGISRSAVTLWENSDPGSRSNPQFKEVQKAAKFLSVRVEYLTDPEINTDDIATYVIDPNEPKKSRNWSEEAIRLAKCLENVDDPARRAGLLAEAIEYIEFKMSRLKKSENL